MIPINLCVIRFNLMLKTNRIKCRIFSQNKLLILSKNEEEYTNSIFLIKRDISQTIKLIKGLQQLETIELLQSKELE